MLPPPPPPPPIRSVVVATKDDTFATNCAATDYTPVTTTFDIDPTEAASMGVAGEQCFCQCPAGSMAGLYWGTDANHKTTSWCAGGSPITTPAGVTRMTEVSGCGSPTATEKPSPATPTRAWCSPSNPAGLSFHRDVGSVSLSLAASVSVLTTVNRKDAITKICSGDPTVGNKPLLVLISEPSINPALQAPPLILDSTMTRTAASAGELI